MEPGVQSKQSDSSTQPYTIQSTDFNSVRGGTYF